MFLLPSPAAVVHKAVKRCHQIWECRCFLWVPLLIDGITSWVIFLCCLSVIKPHFIQSYCTLFWKLSPADFFWHLILPTFSATPCVFLCAQHYVPLTLMLSIPPSISLCHLFLSCSLSFLVCQIYTWQTKISILNNICFCLLDSHFPANADCDRFIVHSSILVQLLHSVEWHAAGMWEKKP